MRVVYVEGPVGFGGSLTGLIDLFGALPPDVEPILVTSFDPKPYVDLPTGLEHVQIDVPPRSGPTNNWLVGAMRYYRELVRPWQVAMAGVLRCYRPDLIHANNSVMVNLGAGWAAKRAGIPSISHQKGFEYPGRLARWVVRNSGFTHHLATSGAIATHLQELGLAPELCTTVYEPVLGPPASALDRGTPPARPVVAMHSILGPHKGQQILLEAVHLLQQRGCADFDVHIAGGPPAAGTDFLNQLKRFTADHGLEGRVRFVGHLRNVYEFLAGVDIAVHASVKPEPFGRVVAEAMLCGLPNIVTTAGGPAEYVSHGKMGLHVPCNDPRSMADALEELLRSAERRRDMGACGRQYAEREFAPPILAKKVVDVYHRVLGGEPPVIPAESA